MNITIDSTVKNIIYNGNPVQRLVFNGTEVWSASKDYSVEYLTIEALSAGYITFNYITQSSATTWRKTVYYSKNEGSWTAGSWGSGAYKQTFSISVSAGDKVRLKSTSSTPWHSGNTWRTYITFTANVNISGNIFSLIYGDNFASYTSYPASSGYWFKSLFTNNYDSSSSNRDTHILSAENLYLGYVNSSSFYRLFAGCSNLSKAPKLPATTLAYGCYESMFENCTSLTTSPDLPASILSDRCYYQMFAYCTSLTTGPQMVINTVGNSSCRYMFTGCSNLENTGEIVLYATYGASDCYRDMFLNCSKVNTVKCFLTSPSSSYTKDWLSGASSTGTFYKLASASWSRDVNGIPSGWSIVNI